MELHRLILLLNYQEPKPSKQYVFKTTVLQDTFNSGGFYAFTTSSGNLSVNGYGPSIKFIDSVNSISLEVGTGTSFSNFQAHLQLNEGTVALPYRPYIEPVVLDTLQFEDNWNSIVYIYTTKIRGGVLDFVDKEVGPSGPDYAPSTSDLNGMHLQFNDTAIRR